MLRSATLSDIPWIDAQQRRPGLSDWIHYDGPEHLAGFLKDPDVAVHIWEEAGQVAGFAMLSGLARADRVILIRRLLVAEPGRGIGSRFVARLTEHIFAELGAHRVWLDHYVGNDAAAATYARAGFEVEGCLREHGLRQNGERGSLVLMGLLRRDWEGAADRGADPGADRA